MRNHPPEKYHDCIIQIITEDVKSHKGTFSIDIHGNAMYRDLEYNKLDAREWWRIPYEVE